MLNIADCGFNEIQEESTENKIKNLIAENKKWDHKH